MLNIKKYYVKAKSWVWLDRQDVLLINTLNDRPNIVVKNILSDCL